jgi:hypothetical protein
MAFSKRAKSVGTMERCLACEADGRGNLDSREKAQKAQKKEDKLNRGWTQIYADAGGIASSRSIVRSIHTELSAHPGLPSSKSIK